MRISRRTALKATGSAALGLTIPEFTRAWGEEPVEVIARGNPIIPGRGVCDPHVRIYDNHIYMCATHDASPKSTHFVMHNWWVWHSTDLVHWELVSILKPEQTYFRKPSSECWATDTERRNGKYYIYFSMGPENIGVVVGDSPAGPWRDPLGHPLIAKGLVPTESRDPGIYQEPDGTSFIVFGTFDYYLARLNDDMISLAEMPKLIQIENPEGPYGKGRTDDKPYLHRHGGKYYLSWGCYYAVSDSLYGPYHCKGSIITPERVAPEFRNPPHRTGPQAPPPPSILKDWLGYDRHASFFELYGQWYFICNDQSLPGSNMYFRNSVISYVRYMENGNIDPIWLTPIGVGQYDASVRIPATDFFKAVKARVAEAVDGRFQVRDLSDGSCLVYPRVHNLRQRPKLSISASSIHSKGLEIDIRRGNPAGARLAKLAVKPQAGHTNESILMAKLNKVRDTDDLCLVFRGGPGELIRLNHLDFR